MLKYDFYWGWYWQSNDVIANVIYRDLDQYFQDQTSSGNNKIFSIWTTVRTNEKCSRTTVVDVDIGHRRAQLQMLYIMTLTCIFMVTSFWNASRYMNGSCKRVYSRKIPSDLQSGVQVSIQVYPFLNISAFFSTFSRWSGKTRIVSFLANCSTNSRLFL